jgi:hypothetical protein
MSAIELDVESKSNISEEQVLESEEDELKEEEEDELKEESEEVFYKDIKINMNNTYLLILYKSDKDKYEDYIGDVIEINDDNFILENDSKKMIIKLSEDGLVSFVLDTNTKIKDIICIREIELEVELLGDDDIFKEKTIELELEEVKKQYKKYNDSEIKEDFISEIINLYNIYDNELLIKKITQMAYSFFDLIKKSRQLSDIDKTDKLSFIKNMINNGTFKLPKYILPIVALKKKLYLDGDESVLENTDTLISTPEEELVEKYRLMTDTGYLKQLNILFENKYNSYIINDDKQGFIVDYNGHIVRDCLNESNPCNGIDNGGEDSQYIIDLLKSRELTNYLDGDELNISVNRDKYNIIGLLFIPEKLSKYGIDLSLDNDYFNLHENILISNRIYSIVSFRENLLKSDIIYKEIGYETGIEKYEQELLSYMFDLNKKVNLEEISDLFNKTIPTNKSIVDSIDKGLFKNIYNIDDFEKLMILYNIKINDLLEVDRKKYTDIIKENIDKYGKIYIKLLKSVIKPLKKLKKINKKLDTSDKIKLSLEYIFRNNNIIEKNNLITKFIKIYCRESNSESEDSNWLYSNKTNEKILCKHYYYSSKIDKNPEYYDNLKSIFCHQPEDGHVSCKVCGHLIDNVDFSTFSGYSDGQAIAMNAVLEEETINKGISDGNDEIKRDINNISKIFNIKLYSNDLESIVSILSVSDDNELIDYRYDIDNYIDKYSDKLGDKYTNKTGTSSESSSNSSESSSNSSESEQLSKNKILRYYEKYLLNTNKLLCISFLIFIHIQISNNTYKLNLNDMYNVLIYNEEETWKNLNMSDDNGSINKKIIQYIQKKLQKLLEENLDRLKEKELDDFNFEDHFIKTIKYFMGPQFNLYNIVERYFNLNKGLGNQFVKVSWPSYKPLYDNILVLQINNYISSKDKEMKKYFINNDSLENISLLKDINKIVPKYQELKLLISDIMSNPSYKRLYMYSLKLYGKSTPFPLLDLLVKKFLNDIKDEHIKQLLVNYKDGSNINYNKLKRIITGITEYEISKKDKDNIKKFKYINLNNTEYILLNSVVNNIYKYEPGIVSIDLPLKDLLEKHPQFIEKLFRNYCLNDKGDLIENIIDENILNYYLLDYKVKIKEDKPECKKSEITKTQGNFELIMSYLTQKNKLLFNPLNYIEYTEKYNNDDIFKYLNFNKTIEDRLLGFFNDSPDEQIFNEITDIIKYIKGNKEQQSIYDERLIVDQLDDLENNITKIQQQHLTNISGLFKELLNEDEYYSGFNELQLDRLKSIPNINNIEDISLLIDKLTSDINNSYIYKRLIDDTYYIISRLKNGYKSHNVYRDIKKNLYKLSDTNIDSYNEFKNINEFLLHNDLYFKRNQKDLQDNLKYSGFKQYENNNIYFEGLFNYINKYNFNLHKLKGSSNNIFNSELLLKINKYIFIFIINKISEYIKELIDISSETYKITLSKLSELDDEEININNNIICLSRFLLDLIMNMYEKYYDPNWVYISEELLNKSIMKQVSREKQTYLKKTTQMTKEQKYQNDLMNSMGKGTLYKETEKDNIEFAESDEWEQMAIEGRIDPVAEEEEEQEEEKGYDYDLGEGDGFDDGLGEGEEEDE